MHIQLQPQSLIADRFRVLELAGRGGHCAVYRALDEAARPPCVVALKIVSRSALGSASSAERLRREAQLVCVLRHQNTVRYLAHGEDLPHDLLYLVMEWLEGETLGALLAREAPLDPRRALGLLEQIAESLHEAHEEGLIHRDLKPDNIMLLHDRGGATVKVIDFGLARSTLQSTDTPRLTRSGAFVGSPYWIAPEQIRGVEIDRRADVYSLCVIAYQMFAARLPFTGQTPAEVLKKHCQSAAPSLLSLRQDLGLPRLLSETLLAGLSKAPADRPPNMPTLVHHLRRAILPDQDATLRVRATPGIVQLKIGAGSLASHRQRTVSASPSRQSAPISDLQIAVAGALIGLLLLSGMIYMFF